VSGGPAGCLICALDPVGDGDRLVLDGEHWRAWVLPGFEVPGWVAVALVRHGEGPSSPTDAEAATFGAVVRTVSRALEAVAGAERVYLSALGELHPHWHVMLVPRSAGVPPADRGLSLLASGPDRRDDDGALALAAEVRGAIDG